MSALPIEWPAAVRALDRTRHAIIEASAGTGKTYTLEHLVLALVLDGAPIEEILVVTFTDKATREMRARLRRRLEEAARALASAPHDAGTPLQLERVRGALVAFDRASISTIHAFCQRILVEHAFLSGRPLSAERLDGRQSFSKAYRHALRRGLARTSPLRSAWESALSLYGKGPVQALELLLYAWVREHGEIEPQLDLSTVLTSFLAMPPGTELLEESWRAAELEIPSLTMRARLRDALFALAHVLDDSRAWLTEMLAQERADEVLLSPLWGALLAWARASSDPREEETNVVLLLRAFESAEGPQHRARVPAASVLLRALGSPIPTLLRTIAPEVKKAWDEEKAASRGVDFDDMITSLADLVQQREVRAAIRAKLRHALVDEFQDTDDVQWGIFRALFVDTHEDDAHTGRTLTVIGDAKQAIYGFRSADVHSYLAACAHLEACGAQRIRLGESYRSTAPLLDAVHRLVFAPEDEPAFFTGAAKREQAIDCGKPSLTLVDEHGETAPALVVQHLLGVPELRFPLVRRSLAAAIAEEIASIQEGAIETRDGEGESKRIPLGEIFVLTRSAIEGNDVAEALRKRGIPHAFFKQSGLFRTREARHVLDVLRAVSAPYDRNLRVQAFLTPFFSLPVGDLQRARSLPSEHAYVRRIARWSQLAERGQLAALFDAIWNESGHALRALYMHQSERGLVNIEHLFEIALELATTRRLHLQELVVLLGERVEQANDPAHAADDEDIQRLESERDAVQILTMHKSKGLEAEVVFLFGGFGKPPKRPLAPRVFHEGARRVAWAGPDVWGDALEEQRVKDGLRDEARQEDERLYYVAMTRAKSRLYLPYFGAAPKAVPRRPDVSYDPPHFRGPYAVVNERLRAVSEKGELLTQPFAYRSVEVRPKVRVRPLAPSLPEALPMPTRTMTKDADLLRFRHQFAGFEITSYTRMKRSREDVIDDVEPTLALLKSDEREMAREPGGAEFGVLVHGMLETLLMEPLAMTRTKLAALDDEALLAHFTAAQRSVDDVTRDAALLLVRRALMVPVTHPLVHLEEGFLGAAKRAVEMPFLFAIPSSTPEREERGFIRGVVDLLFEHEEKIYVLDWKTDRLSDYGKEAVRIHSEDEYRVQAALYVLATVHACGIENEANYGRFGGVLYVYVRGLSESGEGLHAFRPTWREVCAWEAQIREGDAIEGYPLPVRRGGAS